MVTLWGKNFNPHLMAHLGRDPDSFASWRIDTEVVFPIELQMRFQERFDFLSILSIKCGNWFYWADRVETAETAEIKEFPAFMRI